MDMLHTKIKFSLTVLALAGITFSCTEADTLVLGSCPVGQIMVGQASKSCVRAPLGAENEVRQLYQIAEIKSGQATEQYASIVFDRPMKVVEVLQLLDSFEFHCGSVYFYDFGSRMYSSRETAKDCRLLSVAVAGGSGDSNTRNQSTLRAAVVLSVSGRGLASHLLHFWQTHPDIVRAVSISLSPNVPPPQFKPYPQVEE